MTSIKPVDLPDRSHQTDTDKPLSLTVHAMLAVIPPNTSGRWKMFAVLLVCAAPVIASYFTYYVLRPEGRRNYGQLINPQRPLPALPTLSLDGKTGALVDLKNQWLLISVSGGACDALCQKHLYFQRQLREALGKGKDRLDRVWLINDEAAVDGRLLPALAGSTTLRVAADGLALWLLPEQGQRIEDHIYVVDPLGNLMLRFPGNMDAAGATSAKRDLDRLMRASASWDKDGR